MRRQLIGTLLDAVFITAATVFGSILLLMLACPSTAVAHQLNLTTAHVELLPGRQVSLEIAFSGADIDRMAKTSVFDAKSGLVDPDKLAASSGPDHRLCPQPHVRSGRGRHALRRWRGPGCTRQGRVVRSPDVVVRKGRRRDRVSLDGPDRRRPVGPASGDDRDRRRRAAGVF